MDVPKGRKNHARPTAIGAGLMIYLTFLIYMTILDYEFEYIKFSIHLLIPLTILAIVSFIDDIKHVSILIRLVVHVFAATYALQHFLLPHLLFHKELLPSLDFVAAVIFFVGIINIYNFLDGIDGISAAQSIHLSFAIILLCYLRHRIIPHVDFVMVIACITLASSAAFLIFNWHPAKIFLGDVGSTVLGFLFGLCLILIASASMRLFVAVSIAALYYIADGFLTILIRLVEGEKVWLPHLRHFFQQAVRNGRSVPEVVIKIAICNFMLLFCSVGSLYYPIISAFLACIVVTITLIHFSYAKNI